VPHPCGFLGAVFDFSSVVLQGWPTFCGFCNGGPLFAFMPKNLAIILLCRPERRTVFALKDLNGDMAQDVPQETTAE
jgi:hypothetical protein